MTVRRDPQVWAAVASQLRAYRARGLTGLMTEDTVRFATAQALADAGTPPQQTRVEWPHPLLRGSRVDLAIGLPTPTALLEFKFPREPNELNAAWTMALGEVLKDFYRLASCPGDLDRLFIYVETPRLRQYMAGAARRYGLDLDVDHVALRPDDAARLPTTAAQIIGAELAAHHVTAHRLHVLDVDDNLRLMVYLVDALTSPPNAAARQLAATSTTPNQALLPPQPTAPQGPPAPTFRGTRDGARREILQAARAVLARSGTDTFTPADIVAQMHRAGTGYAESTITTMVTSHMCTNAPTTYDDLERVDRGRYRLRRHHSLPESGGPTPGDCGSNGVSGPTRRLSRRGRCRDDYDTERHAREEEAGPLS